MKDYRLLTIIGEIDDNYILEALGKPVRPRRGLKRIILIAAALAALLLAAGAAAAMRSGLLDRLFGQRGDVPSRAAVEHLVQPETDGEPVAEAAERELSFIGFHVDEYLLDGDRLYMSYTIQNPGDETLIYHLKFTSSDRSATDVNYYDVPLGGAINGTALGTASLGQAEIELENSTGDALDGCMIVYALRPVADFVDAGTPSPNGMPVIIFEPGRRVVHDYCVGVSVDPTEGGWFSDADGGGHSGYSAAFNHDDLDAMRDEIFAAEDPTLARLRALEALGYVEIAERQVIPLRFENGAGQRRVDAGIRLDVGIGELEIVSMSAGAVRTRLTARLRPYEAWKGYVNREKGYLKARVFLNGSDEPAADAGGDAIVEWGFDFDAASPDEYNFELEWSSRDEEIRTVRIQFVNEYTLPPEPLGKAVEWRL